MIDILPSERCKCSRPRGSGRLYYGREPCLDCGDFIITSQSERVRLRSEEKEADARERKTGQPGAVPDITTEQAEGIVAEALKLDPYATGAALRIDVGRRGRYDRSATAFGRLVAKVRSELGITVRRGNHPRKSA